MSIKNKYTDFFSYVDSIDTLEELDALELIYKENYLRDMFWKFRKQFFDAETMEDKKRALIKCRYIMQYIGARIPMKKQVNKFKCPHGLKGIFISEGAKIGKDCIIFQHVTIGSNTLENSRHTGSPKIGDNCFIGAGAIIIGNVKVGNNCRIGANCIVVEDVPDNCIVVLDKNAVKIIQKDNLVNKFVSYEQYKKTKAEEASSKGNTNSSKNDNGGSKMSHTNINKVVHDKKCISATKKALGISSREAKAIFQKAKACLNISNDDYMNYEFYKLSFDEQKKKHRILARNNAFGVLPLSTKAVLSAVYKTDWDYATAKSDLKAAIDLYSINNKEYIVNNFFLIEKDRKAEMAHKILDEREREALEKEEKEKEKEEKNDWYISRVMQESGWTREEAIEKMNAAKKLTGASYENYSILRFWELTPKEQEKFFTIGFSKRITEKYSKQYVDTRRIMFYKDLFYEAFEDCLGRKCMSTVNMTFDSFMEVFKDEKTILYKPRTGLGGHGIVFFEINSQDDLKDAFYKIQSMPLGVVESFLTQHEEMQKLSANSVNTIRIVTISTNDPNSGIEPNEVHFVYGGVRMSGNDSRVDNLHSGGMIAALDLEKGEICTPGSNHLNIIYETHPVTGVTIKGFKIPYFKESLELIERKCKELQIYGYYGWDIAITENGPVLIEGNNNPGSDGLQTPYAPFHIGKKYLMEKYL